MKLSSQRRTTFSYFTRGSAKLHHTDISQDFNERLLHKKKLHFTLAGASNTFLCDLFLSPKTGFSYPRNIYSIVSSSSIVHLSLTELLTVETENDFNFMAMEAE